MRKLKIGAVIAGLRHLTDKQFLQMPGHVWIVPVIALKLLIVRTDVTGHDTAHSIFNVLSSLVLVAAIVNTHRYLLLGEASNVRWGKTEFRYFLAAIGAYLPLFAVSAGSIFLWGFVDVFRAGGENPSGPIIDYLFGGAIILAILFILIRYVLPMSLVLPARAIGRNDFRYRDGLAAATDNIWRLTALCLITLLIIIICAIPAILVLALMGATETNSSMTLVQQIISGFFNGVTDYVAAIIAAGTLSLTYAGLVQGDARFATET